MVQLLRSSAELRHVHGIRPDKVHCTGFALGQSLFNEFSGTYPLSGRSAAGSMMRELIKGSQLWASVQEGVHDKRSSSWSEEESSSDSVWSDGPFPFTGSYPCISGSRFWSRALSRPSFGLRAFLDSLVNRVPSFDSHLDPLPSFVRVFDRLLSIDPLMFKGTWECIAGKVYFATKHIEVIFLWRLCPERFKNIPST